MVYKYIYIYMYTYIFFFLVSSFFFGRVPELIQKNPLQPPKPWSFFTSRRENDETNSSKIDVFPVVPRPPAASTSRRFAMCHGQWQKSPHQASLDIQPETRDTRHATFGLSRCRIFLGENLSVQDIGRPVTSYLNGLITTTSRSINSVKPTL